MNTCLRRLNTAPMAIAMALALTISSCSIMPSRWFGSSGPRELYSQGPARPDWERTFPPVYLADQPIIIDLYDYFGGQTIELDVAWIQDASASERSWPDPAISSTGLHYLAQASVMPEPPGIPPHRVEIRPVSKTAPADEKGRSSYPHDSILFIGLRVRTDGLKECFEAVLTVRRSPAFEHQKVSSPEQINSSNIFSDSDVDVYPVPQSLRDSGGAHAMDAEFSFCPLRNSPGIRHESVRVIFGNEPIALDFSGKTDSGSESALGIRSKDDPQKRSRAMMQADWKDANTLRIRGLRTFAASCSNRSILRFIYQSVDGRCYEKCAGLGRKAARLFDPRDAIIFSLAQSSAASGSKSHGELGGGTRELEQLLESGRLSALGATCVITAPPFKQITSDGDVKSMAAPALRNLAQRGFCTDSFASWEPSRGDRESWQNAIRSAHQQGISVMYGFTPWIVHEKSEIAREKPGWFASPTMDILPRETAFSRDDLRTPFLRRATFMQDSEGIERMTGYGLWWIRIHKADGLYCMGSDALAPDFWKRLSRRLREEIARPDGRGLYLLGEALAPDAETSFTAHAQCGAFDGMLDGAATLMIRECLIEKSRPLKDFATLLEHRSKPPFSIQHYCVSTAAANVQDLPDWTDLIKKLQLSRQDAEHSKWLALAALFSIPQVPIMDSGVDAGDSAIRISALANMRLGHSALRYGGYQTLHADNDAWIFARTDWNQSIIAAFNRSNERKSILASLSENIKSASRLSILWGDAGAAIEKDGIQFNLPPQSAAFWAIEK